MLIIILWFVLFNFLNFLLFIHLLYVIILKMQLLILVFTIFLWFVSNLTLNSHIQFVYLLRLILPKQLIDQKKFIFLIIFVLIVNFHFLFNQYLKIHHLFLIDFTKFIFLFLIIFRLNINCLFLIKLSFHLIL